MRLLVINDYSIRDSLNNVARGRSPRQFLYGIDYLQQWGHEIIDVSRPYSGLLHRLDQLLHHSPIHLGALQHQFPAITRLNDADAIYSPCHLRIHMLCHARALGMLRLPIVWIAHHPVAQGRLAAFRKPLLQHVLRGSSAVPALSQAVAAQINELAGSALARALPWGPDPDFYPPAEYPGEGVVAAGQTGRDWRVLARAARRAGTTLTVLCQPGAAQRHAEDFAADNIRVILQSEMPYHSDAAKLLAPARALAVPLVAQPGLCGLSSLVDALAAGKPVIATRNPHLDLDIERLGVGFWVDPGDEDGWVRLLKHVDNNPEQAREMGQRARALVDDGFNSHGFAEALRRTFEQSRDLRDAGWPTTSIDAAAHGV